MQNYDRLGKDIFVTKFTKITPLQKNEITFQHTTLQKIVAEQLVSLKAQVVQLSGVKILHTQHNGTLKKQEALVRDAASSTKIDLWENYVNGVCGQSSNNGRW